MTSLPERIHHHRKDRPRLPEAEEIALMVREIGYSLVWMEVVGDRAVWANDGEVIPSIYREYVVYRRSEIEELYAAQGGHVGPEMWKTIHAAKKAGMQIVKGGAGK